MKQETAILAHLNAFVNPVTPDTLALEMGIPAPTVRKHLATWFKIGAIMKSKKPYTYHRPEYYTSEKILTQFVKSQKRKNQIMKAHLTEKMKRRGVNHV